MQTIRASSTNTNPSLARWVDEMSTLCKPDRIYWIDGTPAEKQRLVRNILTVRLANNRRVDVTLSTTGEQSVRRFPFNAKDALTLLSRSGGETAKKKAPAAAPKKKTTP